MDLSRFIEVKSDRRFKELTIEIAENGNIKISKNIRESLGKRVSIFISKDYKNIVLDPAGEELLIKSSGIITAKHSVDSFNRKKAVFPLKYKMTWNGSDKMWKGDLLPAEDLITRSRKTMEDIGRLID